MIFTYTDSDGHLQNITVKIKPDFKPVTVFALKWAQASDGNWNATDRGSVSDKYGASIRIYGRETNINGFINFTEACRNSSNLTNVLTLSSFNAQERIFGADVDYSSPIKATAFMEQREQRTWKGFGLPLKLDSLPPLHFTGGNGTLPQLRYLDTGYKADADYRINKEESYSGQYFYSDHASDSGIFEGTFTFTNQEMIQLRRFMAINRGTALPYPEFIGVAAPFGRRTPVETSGEYVKIINFEDLGISNMVLGDSRWIARLTFVRVE